MGFKDGRGGPAGFRDLYSRPSNGTGYAFGSLIGLRDLRDLSR